MRKLFMAVVVCCALSVVHAHAQKCDEPSIRAAVANHSAELAEDVYYMTGAFEHPAIGREHAEQALKQVREQRKDLKPIDDHPDKIVVSPSGDMAYEYGLRDGSWVDAKTGESMTLHGSYLRVWKVSSGKCVVAAMSARPEKK